MNRLDDELDALLDAVAPDGGAPVMADRVVSAVRVRRRRRRARALASLAAAAALVALAVGLWQDERPKELQAPAPRVERVEAEEEESYICLLPSGPAGGRSVMKACVDGAIFVASLPGDVERPEAVETRRPARSMAAWVTEGDEGPSYAILLK